MHLLWSVFAISVAKRADAVLGLDGIGGIGLLRSIAWIAGEAAWFWIVGVLGGCLAWQISTQQAFRDLDRALRRANTADGHGQRTARDA